MTIHSVLLIQFILTARTFCFNDSDGIRLTSKFSESRVRDPILISISAIILLVISIMIILTLTNYFRRRNYKDIEGEGFSNGFFEWNTAKSLHNPIPIGLRNTRKTCYMNAVVQAVAACDGFVEQLRLLHNQKPNETLALFLNLLDGVNAKSINDDSPAKLTKILEILISEVEWHKTSQQDTYEFLSAVINNIHEQYEDNLPLENNQSTPMKIKMFHLNFIENVRSSKIQNHLGLALNLSGEEYKRRPGVKIETLIENFLSVLKIDDSEDNTTQMFLYKDIPKTLLLHIQANKWDERKQKMFKPQYFIQYENKLCLRLNVVDDDLQGPPKVYDVVYRLKSTVHHSGTISRGHYIAYRMLGNRWFLANDRNIREVSFGKSPSPYLLFYELEDE